MKIKKVLIIRFSSFGDIVQSLAIPDYLTQKNPDCEIHWITRSEFYSLVSLNTNVKKIWSLNRNEGFRGLIALAFSLKNEKYDLIYDAHNNLRSNILFLLLKLFFSKAQWLTRSKSRIKRILLFTFKINLFPKPFKGISSFIEPIQKIYPSEGPYKNEITQWNFDGKTISNVELILEASKNFIVLVPSAAWEMKRWPVEHWKELVRLLVNKNMIILGGKEDYHFCEEIKNVVPDKVKNLSGKLSLIESCHVISKASVVISADTGLLHVADVLGIHAISLMGPTAFGFTTSDKIKTLEIDLSCRPCSKDGRGTCSQNIYQKCMVDIKPESVANEVRHLLHE